MRLSVHLPSPPNSSSVTTNATVITARPAGSLFPQRNEDQKFPSMYHPHESLLHHGLTSSSQASAGAHAAGQPPNPPTPRPKSNAVIYKYSNLSLILFEKVFFLKESIYTISLKTVPSLSNPECHGAK